MSGIFDEGVSVDNYSGSFLRRLLHDLLRIVPSTKRHGSITAGARVLARGLAVTCVLLAEAHASTLTMLLTEKGTMIVIRGDIAADDALSFKKLVSEAAEKGQVISGVQLDSPGGSLIGGFRLAHAIHDYSDIATVIVRGATCSSACFLIFAAGHKKFADYESLIGVHGVADKFGQVTQETIAATQTMARFCEELGVPTQIADRLIGTPPDKIVWLNADELMSMGVTMTGRPVQAQRGSPRETVAASRPRAPLDVGLPRMQSELISQAIDAANRSDYATAARNWRRLAEQGHAPSQYNLAEMYYVGQGVPQNFFEAFKWYNRAAQHGLPGAQLSLGAAYALGRGVHANLTEAYKWLALAEAGFASADEKRGAHIARRLVATRMTARQVAEAEQEISAWTPSTIR